MGTMGKISQVLVAAILLANFALAQQSIAIVPSGFEQTNDNQMTAVFQLTNPTPNSQGIFSVTFNARKVTLSQPAEGWSCAPQGDRTTCSKSVEVVDHAKMDVKLHFTDYFASEAMVVRYEVPAAKLATETTLYLSNSRNPSDITASTLQFSAFLMLALGALLWLVLLYSDELSRSGGVLGFASNRVSRSPIFLSVISNGIIALGLMLLSAPSFTITSAVVFSLAFALGFLLLYHLKQGNEGKRPPAGLTPEQITEEKRKITELIRTAKIKFMKKEIDETTFRKITGDLELEMVKLEAKEKDLAGTQPGQTYGAPSPPAQKPQPGVTLSRLKTAELPPWEEEE